MTPTTLNIVSNYYDCMLTIGVVGVILQVNLTKVLLDQLNMSKGERKITTMDNNNMRHISCSHRNYYPVISPGLTWIAFGCW